MEDTQARLINPPGLSSSGGKVEGFSKGRGSSQDLGSSAGNIPEDNTDYSTSSAHTRLKVLLAEPGGAVRERMAGILEQQGFEVMLAEDGFDVLCRLPELRPDLLLMATKPTFDFLTKRTRSLDSKPKAKRKKTLLVS
jgi:PleD family two-component response regulator